MPTYQYACTSCGHRLEVVQSFSDAALTECPVCSGALRKVFSPVGVVFKGSGFYRTDSRATAKSPAADGKDASKDGSTKEGAKEGASSGSTGSSASTESAGSKGSSGPAGSSGSSSGSSGSSSGSPGSSTTGSAA